MRFVLLNTDTWKKDNCGSPLQIDLCNVIKSPQNKDKGNCPICFDRIKDTNCATTACGHNFCLSCIIKAGRNNNDCPLCRQPVTDTDIVARRLIFDNIPPLPIDRIDPDPELREHLPPLLPRGEVLARRLFRRRRGVLDTY
jgi:hypothetical protein